MFISLKIKNFRSIRESVMIDMTGINRKSFAEDHPGNVIEFNGDYFLKSLILYGRNASGKSNILKAFTAIGNLVNQSDKLKHEQKIPAYEPYLFDKKYINEPVEFEIIFTDRINIKFKFEVKYTANKIKYESLYFYPKGSIAKLYEREGDEFTFGDYYTGDKKSIQSNLLKNQLFLSKSAQSNIPYLKEAFLFFSQDFFASTIHDSEYDQHLVQILSEDMLKDVEAMENVKCLLKAADTNIVDISVNKKSPSEFKLPNNIPEEIRKNIIERFRYEVKTKHTLFDSDKVIGEESLNIENESLGTRKLLAVSLLILSTLSEGGLIIIDELDKSLHPLLTKMIINLFHSQKNNPFNAQLIFATHDISLLDNDIFRRDQVYFVDKEYQGNSILYRLSDLKGVRKDVPYDKWYLSGRFGAIPVIADVDLQLKRN